MLKKYKVFLASSGELAIERKEIAVMISRQNNKWTEKDIYMELVVWEDLLHSFRGKDERIQDYFNKEMLKCDIVIALFYRKVGQFTEEEFRLAYENLKKGKKPNFLFVYFKSGKIEIEEVNEDILKVGKLKKEIQEYQQIYGTFTSIEDLILKLQRKLELEVLHRQAEAAKEDEASREERARQDLENYKVHLEQKFKYLDFAGLKAILLKPLPLENIYVKLRAKESLLLEDFKIIRDFNGLTGELKEEKKIKKKDEDFVTFFKRLHKEKQRERLPLRLLILGKPGSGKTTLMKWISLQCLRQEKDRFFSRFIPVFISLKDLGKDPDHTYRKKSIVNLTVQLMEEENISTDSFMDENLKANRLLFLMDGLDEIGDEKVRREVIDWIQKQYIGQNTLIVTSRFSGLHEASGLKFRDDIPVFAVQDFEMDNVEAFLRNWYRNVEIAVAGEQRIQKAVEDGEKKHQDLMNIIRDHDKLKELAMNPLLLTIIAIVHRTRAVLPRERHKLYEECLKVMIELWNLANRKLDISFSYDNSMKHLSKIAVLLMETQRREMDKKEIEDCCLPAKIEGHSRDTFLKEMVVKAGLLYESEGNYGFLHLTFQEFLAAWYFANSKNQNDILKHYNKDYWKETFKLLVNVGNAELFFEEVIEHLLSKKYWKHMNFWEDCLREIVIEEIHRIVELKFTEKVLDILFSLEYKKSNEELIMQLLCHYPIYKYAKKLTEKSWNLFNNAKHPFIQSVGAAILNTAGVKVQEELMSKLKNRFIIFEKKPKKTNKDLLYFLIQNNNSLLFHFIGRRKLLDYQFVLTQVKSHVLFLQYLALLELSLILDIFDRSHLLDALNFQVAKVTTKIPTFPAISNLRSLLKRLKISKYLHDLLYKFNKSTPFREFLILWQFTKFEDQKFTKRFRVFRNFPDFDEIIKIYSVVKEVLIRNQMSIVEWADLAIERLHNRSRKKLLQDFPNTTEEELKQFRESYVEVIASELSKGNCDILKGKKLTKQKQKRIEEFVTFDEKSVEQMLDFTLDTQHEEEKHTHHLKAFEILGNKDYEKLYKIIKTFIPGHSNDRIRLNALYIFKNML
ncbi:MAG: NACHT domain-containing protein [Candidatus Aminicenantes bacterium]|nr:NACHT domain-containing protein [Candidatus Aminicenantes bacterium]NIM77699.1 NACHT domain-containing protein [Candidatus Aminicenantes bacterium]NIN17012.1 NACHT domain-containing protein [Candidatus Aminicenantes bacterium]NIN40905.1 NACHT domain-containing protein [Candidatus Aminicenantes bacterium]NIN83710.1 NACHT domain-containing protein [Candidatus Aminicenantes bacterium]